MALDPRTDLTSLLCALIDVESVSGNETRLADLVEAALRECGHLEVLRDGDAVVARTHLGRGFRVLIAGHLDTVPVAGNLPARLEQTPDGVHIVGRGACDMKGGVAVQLALAAELADPVRDITWVFYDHEEVDADSNGLGRIMATHPDWLEGDFAILMEPTGTFIEGGCQGTLRVRLTASGQAAHSARGWLGHNAIHDLAPALDVLNRFVVRDVVVDGLAYREGLNAVKVGGGLAGNVIPDRAFLEVNFRYAPNRRPEDAVALVKEWFGGYHIELLDLAPAARPGLDRPEASEFIAAVGTTPRPKYGWTDVARFSELGMPAVNFGPGDPNKAHADDEFCPAADLEFCAAALRRWLAR